MGETRRVAKIRYGRWRIVAETTNETAPVAAVGRVATTRQEEDILASHHGNGNGGGRSSDEVQQEQSYMVEGLVKVLCVSFLVSYFIARTI